MNNWAEARKEREKEGGREGDRDREGESVARSMRVTEKEAVREQENNLNNLRAS